MKFNSPPNTATNIFWVYHIKGLYWMKLGTHQEISPLKMCKLLRIPRIHHSVKKVMTNSTDNGRRYCIILVPELFKFHHDCFLRDSLSCRQAGNVPLTSIIEMPVSNCLLLVSHFRTFCVNKSHPDNTECVIGIK